jgi:hypothetical protein
MIDFLREIKEELKEIGYGEMTIEVFNSWCEQLFIHGFELIQTKIEDDDILVACNLKGKAYSIEVSKKSPIENTLLLVMAKCSNNQEWTYKEIMPNSLAPFAMIVQRSQILPFSEHATNNKVY